MFTGIIEDIGVISAIIKTGGKWEFRVATHIDPRGIYEGDSICVDGVCLTATKVGAGDFLADASFETLNVTTLANRNVGDRVNLERAMRADGRFGGHLVTGHVDGIGTIVDLRKAGDSIRLAVEVPGEIARYIIQKGSVTINGISLTVNTQQVNIFTVNIIPFTASNTTIGEKTLRDKVNIETDLIGKYVESFLRKTDRKGTDLDFLYEHGYIKGE
jgi:riboflavin synthase